MLIEEFKRSKAISHVSLSTQKVKISEDVIIAHESFTVLFFTLNSAYDLKKKSDSLNPQVEIL